MSRPAFIFLTVSVLAGTISTRAQAVNPRNPPPPPPAPPAALAPSAPAGTSPVPAPAAADSSRSADAKPIDPTVPPPPPPADEPAETPAEPAGPSFDPLHAQRSLDVGTFYLRKGSYDAAIDRFLEASNYQPSLAMPWKMLGETYEKKHENQKAIEAYNKYLQILPRASDAARIKKLISGLEEKSAQDSSKKQ
jgi:tetratricopeptide (TPR) repeat protein